MFVHHVAYRFQDGHLEGFAGTGLTPSSARQNSVYVAKAAVTGRSQTFSLDRIVEGCASWDEQHGRGAQAATGVYLAALL